MLGWLYRIIIGKFKSCDHEWVDKRVGRITEGPSDNTIGYYAVQRCVKCGDYRRKEC